MALRHRHLPGACRRANRRTARARTARARDALPTRARARARTFPASFAPRRPARGEPPSVSFLPTQLRRRQLARQIRARYLPPALTKRLSPSRFLASQEWGEFPSSERISPITSLTYEEYKNNVSTEIIHGRFAMLGVTGGGRRRTSPHPRVMAGAHPTTAPSPTSTTPSRPPTTAPSRHHLPRDPPHGRRRGHAGSRELLRRRRRGLASGALTPQLLRGQGGELFRRGPRHQD